MANQPPFEVLDHTAEVGIVAHGDTLSQAFENAAMGMFSLIADLSQVRETEQRRIAVEGRDEEGLLVNWLSELLYLFEVDGILFRRFHIAEMTERHLTAIAYGEPFSPERHEPSVGVKAVTRHMLQIERENGGYKVRVIFDV